MQIQQISVSGLFGIFDHVIPLNTHERITIIHGPNGFGKTIVLKMLDGFFNAKYSVFRTIPFTKFQILFDDGSKVEISKEPSKARKSEDREIINIDFYRTNQQKLSTSIKRNQDSKNLDFPLEMLENIIPGLQRVGIRTWLYLPTNETLDLNEALERFGDVIPIKRRFHDELEWLVELRRNVYIRLIESQRLLDLSSGRYSKSQRPISPTVTAYSDEIAENIQLQLTKYGAISQSLDRSFPVRVVQRKKSSELTNEQLSLRLDQLEKTRSHLIEIGLLDQGENSDFQIQPQEIKTTDDSTKNILSVYVEDVEKKLSVFDELANKIELLQRILNKKFTYKEIYFDKKRGFVFKTLQPFRSHNQETISPTDLSSGEQHELVLLYELLFKVKPKTLVLIDEPELSLHVGWQVEFLQDLQEITKLADIDILMATHSPDIINTQWDLTVELKGPAA